MKLDITSLRATLEKEIRKLDRQLRTVETTRHMIRLIESAISEAEKTK